MSLDRRKVLLFVPAALLRLLLFSIPHLPELLTGRVEVSTPVTSFKRLQEGLFLYTHNVSPYDGGVFHQAPLFLPIFSLIPSSIFNLATKAIYILLDILIANLLITIADSRLASRTPLFASPRQDMIWDSLSIGAAYLFNPLTIATCLGRSTILFTHLAILLSITRAIQRRPLTSMLSLGLASYLSLYPALLLPPLLLLIHDQHSQPASKPKESDYDQPKPPGAPPFTFTVRNIFTFAGGASWLLYLSRLITGSREYISSVYGTALLLPDLTPNVGLWWYFFIEMFDSFREFFLGVFWLHLSCYVGGLCIRIRKQPLFVIVTIIGLFAVFKPYPSVSDTALYLGLLPLYRHIFPLMRYTFISVSTLLYATLLGPAFYHLWIYAGSGNANFFYAITLVWSLGLVLIIADSIFAVLRDEWEVERPEGKGKDIRQI